MISVYYPSELLLGPVWLELGNQFIWYFGFGLFVEVNFGVHDLRTVRCAAKLKTDEFIALNFRFGFQCHQKHQTSVENK